MKKKAFSLIELLISLITISVILASMAPIITHKLKHGGVSIGTKKLSMKCPNTVGSDCTLCLGNQCIACPIGCGTQFKNTLTCKCETCTVANCANCASGANQCDKCKAGYQKSGNSCSACPSGQYSTEGGTCQKCAKGSKANANSAATGCVSCTGNQYQDEEGKTDCKNCNPGFVTDSNRACKTCAAGTYWNSGSCQNCGAGTYSNSANVTSCSNCPSGQYQPSAGQTSCLPCSGAVNDSKTACRSCSDFGANCIGCNYYACTNTSCESKDSCSSTQYYDNCHCQPCPSGQVQSADKLTCYTPSTAPTSCKDGEYLANDKCNPCPSGCTKCTGPNGCTECTNSTGDDPEYLLVNGECKKYIHPTSQEICSSVAGANTIYVPYDYTNPSNGGFCMSSKNAGDVGGPNATYANVINTIKVGSGNQCNKKEKCCWIKGDKAVDKTAGTCSNSSIVINIPRLTGLTTEQRFDYEACYRTLCNWYAADYICRNLTSSDKKRLWNLPSKKALDSLSSAIKNGPTKVSDTSKFKIQKYSGNTGLQLCQSGTAQNTAGSPRCEDNKYSDSISYEPNFIFGRNNGDTYYNLHLYGDSPYSSSVSTNAPEQLSYSVRCAMEKYVE